MTSKSKGIGDVESDNRLKRYPFLEPPRDRYPARHWDPTSHGNSCVSPSLAPPPSSGRADRQSYRAVRRRPAERRRGVGRKSKCTSTVGRKSSNQTERIIAVPSSSNSLQNLGVGAVGHPYINDMDARPAQLYGAIGAQRGGP
jgi:hypothetical protein